VTFTAPVSGASAAISGSPATVSGGGAATGNVTANSTEGTYTVTATTTGVAASVGFSLRNNAAPAVRLDRPGWSRPNHGDDPRLHRDLQ
jgi:hypothetical protein